MEFRFKILATPFVLWVLSTCLYESMAQQPLQPIGSSPTPSNSFDNSFEDSFSFMLRPVWVPNSENASPQDWMQQKLQHAFSAANHSDVFESRVIEGSVTAAASLVFQRRDSKSGDSLTNQPPEIDSQPPPARRLAVQQPTKLDSEQIALVTATSEIIEEESDTNDTSDEASPSESAETKDETSVEVAEKNAEKALTKQLQAMKDSISSDEQLDKNQKADRLELITSAQNSLLKANHARAKKDQYENQFANFPAELEQLESLTDEDAEPAPWVVEKGVTSDVLQTDLQRVQAQLQEEQQRFEDFDSEIENLNSRITEIPTLRATAVEDLGKVTKSLDVLPEESEDVDNQLRRMVQLAKKIALEAELESFDAETRRQELAGKVFPMKRDAAARRIARLEDRIAKMESAITELRQQEVQRQAAQANLEAINADPALKDLARRNQELTKLRSKVTGRVETVNLELTEVNQLIVDLTREREKLEREIEAAGGVNKTNGMMLVESRRQLDPPFESLARIKVIQAELQSINVAVVLLEEERRPLADPAIYVDEQILNSDQVLGEQVKQTAIKFAQNKRQFLDELLNDYNRYRGLLTSLEVARQKLVDQISENRNYIDQQAIWVRNADPVCAGDLGESVRGLVDFFHPGSWTTMGNAFITRIKTKPHEMALGAIGLLAMFMTTRRLNRRIAND